MAVQDGTAWPVGKPASRERKSAVTRRKGALGALAVLGLGGALATAARATPAPEVSGSGSGAISVIDRQAGVDDVVTGTNDCTQGRAAGASCFQPDTQMEPFIAVNPDDALNAVAVVQEGRRFTGQSAAIGFATTRDGGQIWTHGDLPFTKYSAPGEATSGQVSDPWVAFGHGGVVYASGSPVDGATPSGTAVMVSVSRDGGLTWAKPIYAENGGCGDRNVITVDNGTGTGHHPGRVYMACNSGSPDVMLVTYSDDGGQTWVAPGTFGSPAGATPEQWPTGIAITPSGSLWVANDDTEGMWAPHNQSGGIPNEITVTVAAQPTSGQPLVFGAPQLVGLDEENPVRYMRDENSPSLAIDPLDGSARMCWADGRFRLNDELNDIVCSSSADGLIWSSPIVVSGGHDGDGRDSWAATVAFAPDGRLDLAYRTRQERPDLPGLPSATIGDGLSRQVATVLQQSPNGSLQPGPSGGGFSAPTVVNQVQGDLDYAAVSLQAAMDGQDPRPVYPATAFLGDFMGVASGPGVTYVVRCEAVQTDPTQQAAFPALYRHQRAWVATIRPAPGDG